VRTESRYGTKSFLRLATGIEECSDNIEITFPSMSNDVLMLAPSCTASTYLLLEVNLTHMHQFNGHFPVNVKT